jgi:hypothetical protein
MISSLKMLFQRNVELEIAKKKVLLSWQFNEVKLNPYRVCYYECLLSDSLNTSAGYGEGPNFFSAIHRSFSESAERYIFDHFEIFFEKIKRPTSTNGFAAGPTERFARHRSKLELIERKVVSDAWYLEYGWLAISLPERYAADFLKHGFEVRVYEIINDSTCRVLAGILYHSKLGIYFDSVSDLKKDAMNLTRIMLSLKKGASILSAKRDSLPQRTYLNVDERPETLGEFYHRSGLENMWKHFISHTTIGDPKSCVKVSSQTNEIRTLTLLDESKYFPCVTYSYCSSWPALKWGRRGMYGSNPWHLPLV